MPTGFNDGGQTQQSGGGWSEGAARKLVFELENQLRVAKQDAEYRKRRAEQIGIDADHDFALWFEKWKAALNVARNANARILAAMKVYEDAFAPDHTASEMYAALFAGQEAPA